MKLENNEAIKSTRKNLFIAYLQYEIEFVTSSIRMTQEIYKALIKIALDLWEKSILNDTSLSNFVSFFMENPRANIRKYTMEYEDFSAIVGGL